MFVLFTVFSLPKGYHVCTPHSVSLPKGEEEERKRGGGGGGGGAPPRGLVAKTWSDQNIIVAVSGGAVINRR